jgi:CRP-like cAMP-binding protein
MPDLTFLAADLDAQHFSAGHKFFGIGDTGEEMYVVEDGEVEIILRGQVLETVKTGGIFGELALIDHRERSADVVAKTDVKVGLIPPDKFVSLVKTHPTFALEVMTIMAHRLRRLDDLI